MKTVLFSMLLSTFAFASLPTKFDLRNVDGSSYVSRVKSQNGGTCWTHGTMAAIESNLMLSGVWQENETTKEADLAEYHLDWWNGFNQFFNPDSINNGLTVHQGGDYRVASASLSRGGAVSNSEAQNYSSAPKQYSETYRTYYVRDIEWYDAGSNLEGIEAIKTALLEQGAMGTALHWSNSYYDSSTKSFYQSPSSSKEPNHAVAIVGWDDNKKTEAPKPGAWLIKNSWGTSWGDNGYFWISYYDKVSGHHPEMGAVSFRNVERSPYRRIYSHDVHGWRDTLKDAGEAFNAFTSEAKEGEQEELSSVSFFTAEKDTDYLVTVWGSFENGELEEPLTMEVGSFAHSGFHTVDLETPVALDSGQKFYVAVALSKGGHPFDRTSNVPVLLGSDERVTVHSKAKAGESFYKKDGTWVDLTQLNPTANFCIKALTK